MCIRDSVEWLRTGELQSVAGALANGEVAQFRPFVRPQSTVARPGGHPLGVRVSWHLFLTGSAIGRVVPLVGDCDADEPSPDCLLFGGGKWRSGCVPPLVRDYCSPPAISWR